MSLTTVLTLHIHPDRLRAYEQAVARLAERARESREPAHWTAHQTAFGEWGRIHFVSRAADWATLATREASDAMVRRVMGEREGAELLEELDACVLSAQQSVALERPELSNPPEDGAAAAPIAMITVLRARTDGRDACEELLRKVAEAIAKVDDPGRMIAHQTLVGDLRLYWTVRPLADLGALDAQLAPPELLDKAFGPAEGRLILRTGMQAIEDVQREIVRYRPELSNPGR